MEMHARGDEKLGEILGGEIAVADGAGEAPPEGGAGQLEGREGAGGGFSEGVVDGGAEACPEVCGLGCGTVGQSRGRGGGEDVDELGLGVVWKMDVCDELVEEEVGVRVCDDEDGGDVRDLGAGSVQGFDERDRSRSTTHDLGQPGQGRQKRGRGVFLTVYCIEDEDEMA